MKILCKIAAAAVSAVLIGSMLTACADKNVKEHSESKKTVTKTVGGTEMKIEEIGSFVITLHPEAAPKTCENFEKLVSDGFYDGLTFHRVVDDFMAQGGDPEGTDMGGSSETIVGEFAENGYENNLSHTRGVVSMARSQMYDSASSQFFICYTDDCKFLDGSYAAFGKVSEEDMEIVDKFLEVERVMGGDGAVSKPVKKIVITKAEMIESSAEGNPQARFTMGIEK